MNTKTQLEKAIDDFWMLCRSALQSCMVVDGTPIELSQLIRQYADKGASKKDVMIIKSLNLENLSREAKGHASTLLKLFDCSSNGYVSVANVLLEFIKFQKDLNEEKYQLSICNYAVIDGVPLYSEQETRNKDRCPICNRFPQELKAFALISGNPQTDSLFQTYRKGERENIHICKYCFTAGWVDLPTAKIVKDGQNVSKGREYLFVTTPLSRQSLEDLLAKIEQVSNLSDDNDQDDNTLKNNQSDGIEAFLQALQTDYGIEPSEPLSVLGFHTRRLRELRGFVLQSSNHLQRTLILRVPLERLVGEDKVSGAVRRELIKAAMYDFWRITGGSLHYNRVRDGVPFSVDGQSISLNEMLRANRAYFIADRYARIGKYRQLNSSLFMLLLSQPRQATNRIFNTKKRESSGRYAPGNSKVKEIIDMTEEIAQQDDWQFQLGLRIVELLVAAGLAPKAKGFWKNPKEQYSGVDLVKWIQRIKMARDPDSTRAWGTSLLNGYRREHGYGANTETTEKILNLVEEIIFTCQQSQTPIGEFARHIANMDYYLLFYYNQKQSLQNSQEER